MAFWSKWTSFDFEGAIEGIWGSVMIEETSAIGSIVCGGSIKSGESITNAMLVGSRRMFVTTWLGRKGVVVIFEGIFEGIF
jgi:hypothetical protein